MRDLGLILYIRLGLIAGLMIAAGIIANVR